MTGVDLLLRNGEGRIHPQTLCTYVSPVMPVCTGSLFCNARFDLDLRTSTWVAVDQTFRVGESGNIVMLHTE